MNHACCPSCSRSCLFDPSTAARSSLKWIGVSTVYADFFLWPLLWPAVLVSQLIYLLWTLLLCLHCSFQLIDSTKQAFHCCLGQPKLELNDPTDREMSVLAGSNKVFHIDLGLLRKPKSSHQPCAGFILVSLLPEGTFICSTSAVLQSISAWPNLGKFSARSCLCRHTPVCVLGQHVSCVFIGDRNNEFTRSSINLPLMGWKRLSLSLQCTQ